MSEERRSIGKRLWDRPRLRIFFCLLLTLLLLLAEAVGFTKIMEQTRQHMPGLFMFAALGITALVALLLLFALVIPARLRQRLFNRLMLRRYVFGVVCLATLIAFFYAEENWRGRYLWNRYVAAREAEGEKMNLLELVPPPVPDDQNLAMCPLLKPLLEYDYAADSDTARGRSMIDRDILWRDTNGLSRLQRLNVRYRGDVASWGGVDAEKELDAHPLTNGWINLAAWQRFFRAGTNLVGAVATNPPVLDVLSALRPLGADLAELEWEADRRPLARWPVHYDTDPQVAILLPHLGYSRGIVRTLQLRAAARLANGDTAEALSDMRLGFRLADSFRDEPLWISQVVRIEAYKDLLQAVREGLARHQFTDSQLAELQEKLGSVDFLASYALSMRGERAMMGQLSKLSESEVHEITASIGQLMGEQGAENKTLIQFSLLFIFAPSGWIYQNQLSSCRLEDQYSFPAIDAPARLAHPDLTRALKLACEAQRGPFHLASRVWLGRFLRKSPPRFAAGQTEVDAARIACALERYRLAHGRYPASLDELAPHMDKLPQDLIGGQPLKYRLTTDGRYVLYSIGWNETDDGGQVVLDSDGKPDFEQGDWVWALPGK